MMTRGAADVLEIVVLPRYPNAFLCTRGSGVGARFFAEENPFEGHHARVHEHQARIRIRNHRCALDSLMSLVFEKAQKVFANLFGGPAHSKLP